MSSKMWSICGGVVALALMTVIVGSHGCGSSSSSPANFMASCETACNRELACQDASSPIGMSLCMSACSNANSAMTAQNCPNLGSQVSMANACLAMQSCTGLEACLNRIPGCQGGSGSGGSGSGSGGRTGSGGATGTGGSGAANCSTCARSHACCLATNVKFGIPDGSGCDAYSEAQCSSLSGAAQTQYIATCSDELLAGDSLGVSGCQ